MTTSTSNATPSTRARLAVRWLLTAALAGSVAAAGFFAWRSLQDRKEREAALRLAREDRFEVAQPHLRQFWERHPHDLEIVRALAVGYLGTSQDADAEEFLERWCELAADPEPFLRRIDWCVRLQRMPQALADAKQALRLWPDDESVHRKAATVFLMTGGLEEAEKECRRCLRAAADDLDLWYMLATIQHRQGQVKAAAELADRILQARPDFPSVLLLRGELYLEAKQPAAAIPLLRKAADVQGPDQIEAYNQLGLALARVGREEDARQALAEMEWRRAIDLWSKNTQRSTNLALQTRVVDALVAAGRPADAIHFLKKIIEENPEAAAPHQLLSSLYEKQGRPDLAAPHRRPAGLTP